jgi:hypothetical protein
MKKDRNKRKRKREKEKTNENLKAFIKALITTLLVLLKKNNKINSITSKKVIYTFFLLVNHESA